MKPLTAFQRRALQLLADQGPLLSGCLGEALWPERRFKNSQGAGFAAGGAMGRLQHGLGLVRVQYRRPDDKGQVWPDGWVLTTKGAKALATGEVETE